MSFETTSPVARRKTWRIFERAESLRRCRWSI